MERLPTVPKAFSENDVGVLYAPMAQKCAARRVLIQALTYV